MQINEDRDWEALYQANDTFWDHGEASPGLVDYLDATPSLPPGQALVPGCGRGYSVAALATPASRPRARPCTPRASP